MKIQRTKNAQKGIIIGSISNIYSILLPFVMRTAMLYTLGVQYLGLNSLFSSVLQVLNLAELGVGSAMVYSMYKPIAEDDSEKICALMRLYKIYYRIIGLVILVAGLLIVPFLKYLIKNDLPSDINMYILYALYLSATVFSYWLFAYKNSLLNAFQQRYVLSKIALITNSTKYILQLVSLFYWHNYYFYVIAIFVTQILNNILTALTVDKMYPGYKARNKLSKQEVRKINQRIKDLFTQKIGSIVSSNADTLVISSFLGLTTLAIYQNYYYVMSLPIALANVVFESCCAGIGNSLETESLEKNYNDFKKLTFLIGWFGCVCASGMLVLYQPFMIIWTGENLIFPFSMVILFVVYFYVILIGKLFDVFKDASGIWHKDRFRPLCTAGLNIGLNLILVQRCGIYGVLLSTIISYLFFSIPWEMHNLFKDVFKKGMSEYIRLLLKNIVITTIICISVFLLCNYLPGNGIILFLVKGIIVLIMANIIWILCYFKTEEFKAILYILQRMIHKK